MKELELIALYYYLCECNDTLLCAYNQRFSPNHSPFNEKLTDVELMTIYFYCRRYENKHNKLEIYDYAQRYLKSWFPNLPAYANFNARLNNLAPSLSHLVEQMLEKIQTIESQHIDSNTSVMDSLPVMLCSGKRQGKVAPELSEKSYCATKGVYYFGIKIHAIAFHRKGKLPVPEYLLLSSAAENDLETVRHVLPQIQNRSFFADKAYSDAQTNENLTKNCNAYIYTPVKLIKGECEPYRQFKKAADDLFSTAVSRVRQPIESLFNWIIQKTGIQNASKVRSTNGLLIHTYGAIVSALLFWLF